MTCESCPLEGRKKVEGWGATDPLIAFVGEAPGREEVSEGRPFVGPSGRCLREFAQAVGVPLDRVYYTNAVLCCPPRMANPTATMIKACRERLLAELREVDPVVVVPMGNAALSSLLELRAITRQRGIYREAHGLRMIPMVHPAAVLRDPDYGIGMIEDLQYALAVAEGEDPVIPVPYDDYLLVDGPEKVKALIRRLRKINEPIAADIETTGLDWSKDQILSIALSWARGTAVAINWQTLWLNHRPEYRALRDELGKHELVFHNAQFDAAFLREAGVKVRLAGDTMLAHYAVDERQGNHGLKRLAISLYRAPVYDEDLMPFIREQREVAGRGPAARGSNLEDTKDGLEITREDWYNRAIRRKILEYNAADADYTYRLWEDLKREAIEDEVEHVHDRILIPAAEHFMELERRGMVVDREYLDQLGADWKDQLEELETEMRTRWPELGERKLNSPKAMAEFLYDELGLRPMTRDEYVDAERLREALAEVEDEGAQEYWRVHGRRGSDQLSARSTSVYMLYWLTEQHEFPRLLIDHRLLAKRIGSYYQGILNVMWLDRRIRPRYRLHGTRTGRLSSSSPNIHGIPREKAIKRMFVADPGFVLVAADYAQAEVRMAAHFARDATLTAAVQATDVHQAFARVLYDMTDEELAALPEDERGMYRRGAKNLTFGILYGRGPEGLAPQLGCSVEEATELQQRFFAQMPGFRRWVAEQHVTVREEGEVRSLYGRKRRFPIQGGAGMNTVLRQAVNTPIQSSVSDMTLIANLKILRDLGDRGRPWPHFHDGFIVQVREDAVDEALELTKHHMHDPGFQTDVHFAIEVAVGPSWGTVEEVYVG